MISRKYSNEITTQKAGKFLYMQQREMHENPPTCSLAYLILTIFCISLLKCFTIFVKSFRTVYRMYRCRFLLFFLGIYFFYRSFCLHDFQILVKSRQQEVSTFSCLSIVCLVLTFSRNIYFIKCPVFHFLNLDRKILSLFIHISKFERKTKIQVQCF